MLEVEIIPQPHYMILKNSNLSLERNEHDKKYFTSRNM